MDGRAQAVGKTGVLGPVHLSLLRSRKRLLAQGIDGFRSALATPYSRDGRDKIEKLARLSGRVASKVVGALERRGYDIRGTMVLSDQQSCPPKPESNE